MVGGGGWGRSEDACLVSPRQPRCLSGVCLFIPRGDQKVSSFALIDGDEASGAAESSLRMNSEAFRESSKTPAEVSKYFCTCLRLRRSGVDV